MVVDLDKCRLADGSIKKIEAENDRVNIHVLDWLEKIQIFSFRDVIGLESYSVINASLSHGSQTADDPFLTRCCAISEEAEANFRCFNFFSAWTDVAILKIIARAVEIFTQGEAINS